MRKLQHRQPAGVFSFRCHRGDDRSTRQPLTGPNDGGIHVLAGVGPDTGQSGAIPRIGRSLAQTLVRLDELAHGADFVLGHNLIDFDLPHLRAANPNLYDSALRRHRAWMATDEARSALKADEATIAKSLQGHWREEHIFELTQALELYRFYQGKIAECDREIEAQLERFEDRSDGGSPGDNGRQRSQGNAPRFDVRSHLYRMTGVDLTSINGIDGFTASAAAAITSIRGTTMAMQKYSEDSWVLFFQARTELADGDLRQASEKGWGRAGARQP